MSPETTAKLLEFVSINRLSVIATIDPSGRSHSSVMHYSCAPDLSVLYFSTDNRSDKAKNSIANQRASVAIGWSEHDWITVQMRGHVSVVKSDEEIRLAKTTHYSVHPNSQRFEGDPHTVFLSFRPQWIRYSDLGSDPAIVEERSVS